MKKRIKKILTFLLALLAFAAGWFIKRKYPTLIGLLIATFLYLIGGGLLFKSLAPEPQIYAAESRIFHDTFTETSDTYLTSHTPDVGTSWTQVYTLGSSGKIRVGGGDGFIEPETTGTSRGEVVTADVTYPSANYQVKVKSNLVTSQADEHTRLYIRYSSQGANGNYGVDLSDTTSLDPIITNDTTALVTHDNSDGTIMQDGGTVIFEAHGSDIAVFSNGNRGSSDGEVAMLYVSDSSISATGKGAVGFGGWWGNTTGDTSSTDNQLDDFEIWQLGDTSTGWKNPTTTGENSNDFTNPSNGYASDDSDATVTVNTGTTKRQDYGDFGISIPADSTIRGISVRVEAVGASATPVWNLTIELSKDNGATWPVSKTAAYDYETASVDQTFVFGHARSLWGTTWTPSDFSNDNFRIRFSANQASGINYGFELDHLSVRVIYDAGEGLPSSPQSVLIFFEE